jgi:hypothetical protein
MSHIYFKLRQIANCFAFIFQHPDKSEANWLKNKSIKRQLFGYVFIMKLSKALGRIA